MRVSIQSLWWVGMMVSVNVSRLITKERILGNIEWITKDPETGRKQNA